ATVNVMPLSTYIHLGLVELAHTKLTIELADKIVKYLKGIAKNVLVELRRDQVDDLMPIIEEGEVVEEIRARNDARIFRYPSDCDYDNKIHIDCAYNLKFSCIIVLEDMDAYRDEGMGDVIFGEPFLREVRINAKQFKGIITIHNGNEEVTYQMARLHPRFIHHTNEKCNKIPPLLKVVQIVLCDDIGKLQPKEDIRIFVGYAPAKKAFRIYNKKTRMIIETVHVDFGELTAMAS
nr:integrase, catalytic region, zinc finger, CCHC-type, peptidase aspartic, catalytic [Tanacetum cinerariifolium]